MTPDHLYQELKHAEDGALISMINGYGEKINISRSLFDDDFIFADEDGDSLGAIPPEALDALQRWRSANGGSQCSNSCGGEPTPEFDEGAHLVRKRVEELLEPLRMLGLDINVIGVERI